MRRPYRARTASRNAGSWRGYKARFPNVAPSTCYATGSSTDHTTWTCSTAPRPPATSRPKNASSITASPSAGSCATAATRRSGRWTSGCSSTACRSLPSSSRTASPSRPWTTRCSNTARTATGASGCSSSGAAWPTSRRTTARCASAPAYKARPRGSCPSTAAGTTAPATRQTRAVSRPTTCGTPCCPATA